MVDFLKENGIFVKFRGQGKRNPKAPGSLSDFYIVENCHSHGKTQLVKFVGNSRKWRMGCGALQSVRIRL